MKRILGLFTFSALLFIVLISVASAGGWAVVTLDSMPSNVVVNQPITVAMMIRQHGQTPWNYENVRVRGYQNTSQAFVVNAARDGEGHYTADLTFDKPGTWNWAVSSGLMPEWQAMPPIEVADSVQDEVLLAQANTANAPTMPNLATMMPSMLMLAVGVFGFVACAGGLVYWFRARR